MPFLARVDRSLRHERGLELRDKLHHAAKLLMLVGVERARQRAGHGELRELVARMRVLSEAFGSA